MRILLTMGVPYFPQGAGGAQSSTRQLVAGLRSEEHDVAVACQLRNGGWTEIRSRLLRRLQGGGRFACDGALGHPVYRAWDPTDAGELVDRFEPDVAVIQNGRSVPMARSLRERGVPIVFYFRNVEFHDLEGDPTEIEGARFICNSGFSAASFHRRFNLEATVIPPGVQPEHYATRSTLEHVTLINPHPWKGGLLAAEIARACPEIPFSFVETWSDRSLWREVEDRVSDLSNVRFLPRTGNMKEIYGRTRILLAPSQWEEAWGRVATEAHCSGIPVIGSRRGGLPEAIGEGGLVLDHDAPVEKWAAAVRRLWHDEEEYSRLSEAARRAARRPELDLVWQTRALLGVLCSAIEAGSAANRGEPFGAPGTASMFAPEAEADDGPAS